MIPKILPRGNTVITILAFEYLLTSVCSLVDLEVASLNERLAAILANIWLLLVKVLVRHVYSKSIGSSK